MIERVKQIFRLKFSEKKLFFYFYINEKIKLEIIFIRPGRDMDLQN